MSGVEDGAVVVTHGSRLLDGRQPIDPYFGLPLRYQTDISVGKQIWGYNRSHLTTLLEYIRADMREVRCSGSGSYFMRLPAWVKSSQYCAKITKALERLLKIP